MSSSSSSSLICEISGEPLVGDAVVTPSGHICSKPLLLSKLADNGNLDPFAETETGRRPLLPEQLIDLSLNNTNTILPPRPSVTSMPKLLSLLGDEYQQLVLELFDTRQLLEQTRRELSQSLYQNDAAVRVIARLATERDAARQELETWKIGGGQKRTTAAEQDETAAGGGGGNKRARVEEPEATTPLQPSHIPAVHLEKMVSTWERLSKQRKAQKKQIAAQAPTKEALEKDNVWKEESTKSYHKASQKHPGILAMASNPQFLVTSGRDKQVCVLDKAKQQVLHTYSSAGGFAEHVDLQGDVVAMGMTKKGQVVVMKGDTQLCKISMEDDDTILGVSLHPSQDYVVVLTSAKVHIYSVNDGQAITYFQSSSSSSSPPPQYRCGRLHPDGLIYCAVTSEGALDLWDLKNQSLASTLKPSDAATAKDITSIIFSSNGYHLATVSSTVTIYDLKKQSAVATITAAASSFSSCAFDPSGKYIACGTAKEVVIATAKDGNVISQLTDHGATSSLAWTEPQQLILAQTNERQIRIYGMGE